MPPDASLPAEPDDGADFPPVGARVSPHGVTYRVWAPDHRGVRVHVRLGEVVRILDLLDEGGGAFACLDHMGRAGDLYRFEAGGELRPDPASSFQPEGVEGPSQVVDPAAFEWRAGSWLRPAFTGRVIYELHVGAFTREGTFAAAIPRLDALAGLGVNTVQLMPLADFPGGRNWGYDGVMPFAPARCYGTPDDLRALVDAAHARGLAMILDVVYNHLGPCGNVLPAYAGDYFHRDRSSPWGSALNYGEPAVRRYFRQNARMWLDDYRFDGLRLDATHAIHDDSPLHIVAEIAADARRRGAWIVAEDERNEARVITPARQGGWGADAVWADDFHHTVRVALTGEQHAHFKNYTGSPHEWLQTLLQGWLYEGQYCPGWDRARGTPAGHLPPERFVWCVSNHDQVGNRPLGDRLHRVAPPEGCRAASMLLCLAPYTPLLFMGQEWAAGTPFPFFTDLPGETGAHMRRHRLKEFARYGAEYPADMLAAMPDPQAGTTFISAKLDWDERVRPAHAPILALYTECLRLRASRPVFQNPARDRWSARQLHAGLVALRWNDPGGDWLLLAGLGAGELPVTHKDPFTRPAEGRSWGLVLASEEPRFGGAADAGALWSDTPGALRVRTPGALLLREQDGEGQPRE